MTVIFCPVCKKRVCDSNKPVRIAKLSNSNVEKADISIKCHGCKSSLAVKIIRSVVGVKPSEPPESGYAP